MRPRPASGDDDVREGVDEPCPLGAGAARDDPAGRRREWAEDGGAAAAQDAGLLTGDGRQAVAEKGLVVESDRDDGRGQGLRHVGRVETAAHADLEDRHVDARPAEVDERRGGDRFEVGRMRREGAGRDEAIGRGAHFAHSPRQRRRGERPAVHRDALAEAHEVRRRVAPDPQAGGAERGVHVGDHRALAVGAGHEERGVGPLGMVQGRHEDADGFEPELDAEAGA